MNNDDELIKIHKECIKKLIPFILCIKSFQALPSSDITANERNIQITEKNAANEALVTSIMTKYADFQGEFTEAFSQTPKDYILYGGITSNDLTSEDNITRIFGFYKSLFEIYLYRAVDDGSIHIDDQGVPDILVSLSKKGSILTTPELPEEISTDDINAILKKLDEKINSDYKHLFGGKRVKKYKRSMKYKKQTAKRRPRRKSTAIKRRRRRTSRK
jgi:hypothetical protein